MKRKLICKHVLIPRVLLPALAILLSVPGHAQQNSSGTPPGMEDNGNPFGGPQQNTGPKTFGGKPAVPDVPAVSSFPGEIHGVTRYPGGLPLPGATVAILNPDADVDRTTVSGSDGAFVFKNLKPGEYQVTATKEGFTVSPVAKVQLAYGKISTVDVPLGQSLAVSPVNTGAPPLMKAVNRPAYRVQPASMHLPATEPAADETVRTTESTLASPTASTATAQPAAENPEMAAVVEEVMALKKRLEELETELKAKATPDQPAVTPEAEAAPQDAAAQAPATPKPGPGQYLSTAGTITYYKGDTDMATHPDGWQTFSYADWSWMNAAGRNHDSPMATKYFTPEFRVDANYILDFNHPNDDTMGGSTEEFRSDEWQLEQMSFGGDIRIGHVRGRVLTMTGLWATATPRNDASAYRGQWDLNDAYRYFSEAWGGYSFEGVGHGLNIDAGIFVSYIGLFSYYNFDNWAYQPSYVSSNTPWFFNGLRIQYFPTAKLKIEPWFINGWQSYARYNSKPGLGGQILWRPKPYFSAVFNDYGMGTDVLGSPATSRIHGDYSFELREYNKQDNFLDMAAASLTLDAGCQYGGGQNCFNDKNGGYKSVMLGYMMYQRLQFKHDLYGFTFGGGYLNNPGRYLTLLPPINGANAVSGSPYFTENPGDPYHAYDFTATFDYMPSQWLTFRWEAGYRHADVPYFSGKGGITPPGGNTGVLGDYVCTNGVASAPALNFLPTGGPGSSFAIDNKGGAVAASCSAEYSTPGNKWTVWQPDLRHSQVTALFSILTRF
jgi:putative OmpL-like beta-barrel porin-2/carboxypeptidase family protein